MFKLTPLIVIVGLLGGLYSGSLFSLASRAGQRMLSNSAEQMSASIRALDSQFDSSWAVPDEWSAEQLSWSDSVLADCSNATAGSTGSICETESACLSAASSSIHCRQSGFNHCNSSQLLTACDRGASRRAKSQGRLEKGLSIRMGEVTLPGRKLDTSWTFRGVNEYGLCFDWLGARDLGNRERSKASSSIALSNKLLQSCRNIDEVVEFYLANYRDLDGSGTASIVDRRGDQALVAWKDGEVVLERSQNLSRSCSIVDDVTLQ